MARPAICPTAHRSAWFDDADPARHAAELVDCRFCGEATYGWHAPYHLNGDHADGADGNVVPACPLCHLPQHLNRPTIEHELALIWLPELPQAAITLLVREIDIQAQRAGVAPADIRKPVVRIPAALTDAHAAFQALLQRGRDAVGHLPSVNPRHLAAALQKLRPETAGILPERLGGIRFLPLGQLYANGIDVYPAIVKDWASGKGTA